jgi:hypothetical protein
VELLFKRERFGLGRERQGMKHVKLMELEASNEWFFYLYSCNSKMEELVDNTEEIRLTFAVINNNSHFGVNEYLIPVYVLFVALWVVLTVSFGGKMASLLGEFRPNSIKMIAFAGMVLMGVGYLYELINLFIYYSDGAGVGLFHVFYIFLKGIGEGIVTTMLVSFAWGWSIIHVRGSWGYVFVGATAGVIDVVCLALSSLA